MKNKIITRLKNRVNDEQGASTTIEFLFVIIVLFIFTMSIIDLGIYFNDRNIVTNAAQNGARITSVYGGSGNTNIAQSYAKNKNTQECSSVGADASKYPAACNMVQEMNNQKSAGIDMTIKSAQCYVNSPNADDRKSVVETLSDRPTCTITWQYKGIPGSAVTLFNTLRGPGDSGTTYTVTETANAEVIQTR